MTKRNEKQTHRHTRRQNWNNRRTTTATLSTWNAIKQLASFVRWFGTFLFEKHLSPCDSNIKFNRHSNVFFASLLYVIRHIISRAFQLQMTFLLRYIERFVILSHKSKNRSYVTTLTEQKYLAILWLIQIVFCCVQVHLRWIEEKVPITTCKLANQN